MSALDDQLLQLFASPTFQLGVGMLGSARGANSLGQGVAGGLAQAMAMQAAQRKQLLEEREANARIPYLNAQTEATTSESKLRLMQAEQMARQQARVDAMLGGLFGGGGGAPAAPAAPAMVPGPDEQNPLVRPPMSAPSAAPAGAAGGPAGGLFSNLPPNARAEALLDLAFNGGKGLPGVIQNNTKPVAGANGIMYDQGPNGLAVNPTSMDAYRQMRGIDEQTKAASDLIKVPYGTQEVMMPRDQAAAALRAPTAGATVANNNFGNLRPPGATQGFQSFATPEEGVAAIDRQLQIYGEKHGVDTLRGVISRWAPPNENPTAQLVAKASRTLGINPDAKIDLSNPAVRQAVGTTILLQEQGPNLFAKPASSAPRLGMTAPPEQTLEGKRALAEIGKTQQETQGAQAKAAEAQANDKMALDSLSYKLNMLSNAAGELVKHPGLPANTGITGATGLYKLTPDGRDAAAKLDSLRAKITVEVMNDLKSASKTGSTGFGQLSEQEGQVMRDYIDSLNKAQSLPQLKEALANIQSYAQQANKRFTNRFNQLYGSEDKPSVSSSIGAQPVDNRPSEAPSPQEQPMSVDEYLRSRRKARTRKDIPISSREAVGQIRY